MIVVRGNKRVSLTSVIPVGLKLVRGQQLKLRIRERYRTGLILRGLSIFEHYETTPLRYLSDSKYA